MKNAPWPISCLLAVVIPSAGAAQGLADPTRPPNAADALGEGVSAGGSLQSVILSSRRKLAVIDGQTVALGGKAGEFTLVALSASEAVLRRGEETRILKLYPAAEKKGSKPGPRGDVPKEARK